MVLHLSCTSFGDLTTKRVSFSWRQRLKKVEHSSQDGVALSSMLMYFFDSSSSSGSHFTLFFNLGIAISFSLSSDAGLFCPIPIVAAVAVAS